MDFNCMYCIILLNYPIVLYYPKILFTVQNSNKCSPQKSEINLQLGLIFAV